MMSLKTKCLVTTLITLGMAAPALPSLAQGMGCQRQGMNRMQGRGMMQGMNRPHGGRMQGMGPVHRMGGMRGMGRMQEMNCPMRNTEQQRAPGPGPQEHKHSQPDVDNG